MSSLCYRLLLTVILYRNRLSGSDEALLSQAAKRQTYSRWHSTASMVTVKSTNTKNPDKYLYTYKHMEQPHLNAHARTHSHTHINPAFMYKPIYFNQSYIWILYLKGKNINKIKSCSEYFEAKRHFNVSHTLIWIMLDLNTISWHFIGYLI